MKSGISRRQGGHQVAQKLRTRTLPLYEDKDRELPWRSLSEKSGAGTASASVLAWAQAIPVTASVNIVSAEAAARSLFIGISSICGQPPKSDKYDINYSERDAESLRRRSQRASTSAWMEPICSSV